MVENCNHVVGNSFSMSEHANLVGQNVAKHREAKGWSQARLAKEIGVKSQNTIAAIELGKTRKSKYLPDIARKLKVKITDLDPRYEEEETIIIPNVELEGLRDFKVYGSVEAGEGAIVISNEPVQITRRPASLIDTVGGYGVIVRGDSMTPAVRPGNTVHVNPHIHPRAEDLCLFIYDQDGDFRATLKEYCGETPTSWRVKRYSPKEETYLLAKKDFPRCEVVVEVKRR